MIQIYITSNDASDCAAVLCFSRYEYHCIEDIGEPYRRIVELIDAADGLIPGIGVRMGNDKLKNYYIRKEVVDAKR